MEPGLVRDWLIKIWASPQQRCFYILRELMNGQEKSAILHAGDKYIPCTRRELGKETCNSVRVFSYSPSRLNLWSSCSPVHLSRCFLIPGSSLNCMASALDANKNLQLGSVSVFFVNAASVFYVRLYTTITQQHSADSFSLAALLSWCDLLWALNGVESAHISRVLSCEMCDAQAPARWQKVPFILISLASVAECSSVRLIFKRAAQVHRAAKNKHRNNAAQVDILGKMHT